MLFRLQKYSFPVEQANIYRTLEQLCPLEERFDKRHFTAHIGYNHQDGKGKHIARGKSEDAVEFGTFIDLHHFAPRKVVGQKVKGGKDCQP